MKLVAITTFLVLAGTDAIYYHCCKTTSEECPGMMDFNEDIEVGENYKMCCQPDLQPDQIPTDNFLSEVTCIDDIKGENGMSISAMAIGVPEATTTSVTGTCCELDAVVEPGKLRSSTSSNCPINMHSIADTKGPKNNPLCCDAEDASLDNLEGIIACSQMPVIITNLSGSNDSAENNNELQGGELSENQEGGTAENQEGDPSDDQGGKLTENMGGEPAEVEEGKPVDDGETTDNVDDSQQALDESNSANAASAAFIAALLSAAVQFFL